MIALSCPGCQGGLPHRSDSELSRNQVAKWLEKEIEEETERIGEADQEVERNMALAGLAIRPQGAEVQGARGVCHTMLW